MTGIYAIKNMVNGMMYIGQSICVNKRIINHKSDLMHNRFHNDHLQKSYNKYGIDNFIFGVIEICNKEQLNERERYWISFFNSNKRNVGYNVEDGGSRNKSISKETRDKISKTLKGFKISEETRKKLSIALRGMVKSEEWRKNIRKSRIGKTHSEEAKKNMSLAKIGKFYPNRCCFKKGCVPVNKGTKLTIEQRIEQISRYHNNSIVKLTDDMVSDVLNGMSRRAFQNKYEFMGLWKLIKEFYIIENKQVA